MTNKDKKIMLIAGGVVLAIYLVRRHLATTAIPAIQQAVTEPKENEQMNAQVSFQNQASQQMQAAMQAAMLKAQRTQTA